MALTFKIFSDTLRQFSEILRHDNSYCLSRKYRRIIASTVVKIQKFSAGISVKFRTLFRPGFLARASVRASGSGAQVYKTPEYLLIFLKFRGARAPMSIHPRVDTPLVVALCGSFTQTPSNRLLCMHTHISEMLNCYQ
jgi:hypothetical protein